MKTTHEICEFLESRFAWNSTSQVLKYNDIPTTQRFQLLTMLHHLHSVGVIGRFGKGKYKWKMSDEQKTSWRAKLENTPMPVAPPTADPMPVVELPPVAPPAEDSKALKELQNQLERMTERLKSLEANQDGGKVTLKVKVPERAKAIVLEDVVLPETFQIVLDLAAARRNILLVGPTGCGKTHLAKLVADSLGLSFAALSCTAGMSESHLIGRSVPNLTTGEDHFKSTGFLQVYENGGVFLADEIDAADPNLLLTLNTAIANGYCPVPAREGNPVAKKHPDFIIIASANTYGHGPDRVYAGRNQLDEASLDRFRIGTVSCDYDARIEAALCPDSDLRTRLQTIRKNIENHGLRRVMSTRFLEDAYKMSAESNWTETQILNRFFEGWPKNEQEKALQNIS